VKRAVFTIAAAHVPCGDLTPIKKLTDYSNGGDALLFLTHDCPPGALPYDVKLEFVKGFFEGTGIEVVGSEAKTVDQVFHELWEKGYEDVLGVFGELGFDDATMAMGFNGRLTNVDAVDDEVFFEFKSISIKNDPDVEDRVDESARLSVYVEDGDLGAFLNECSLPDARGLYDALSAALGHDPVVKAADPYYRDVDALVRDRETLVVPLTERLDPGLRDRMTFSDVEVEDRMALVEKWSKEKRTNPFVV
jgi:hypothetical protein